MNISCTSTGIPVPIMIWKLDNIVTSFNQTDVITDFEVNATRRNSVPEVISGNIVSTLHIENVQYPTHYGVYMCIGSNPDNTSISSTATITLEIAC